MRGIIIWFCEGGAVCKRPGLHETVTLSVILQLAYMWSVTGQRVVRASKSNHSQLCLAPCRALQEVDDCLLTKLT